MHYCSRARSHSGGSASSSAISVFLICAASSRVLPLTHSVNKELEAMAAWNSTECAELSPFLKNCLGFPLRLDHLIIHEGCRPFRFRLEPTSCDWSLNLLALKGQAWLPISLSHLDLAFQQLERFAVIIADQGDQLQSTTISFKFGFLNNAILANFDL